MMSRAEDGAFALLRAAKPAAPVANREASMRLLAVIDFLAILVVIAAGIYFFGGYYSVAAATPNPGIVDWALEHIRDASVDHREGNRVGVDLSALPSFAHSRSLLPLGD
jgi:hypothetical protein